MIDSLERREPLIGRKDYEFGMGFGNGRNISTQENNEKAEALFSKTSELKCEENDTGIALSH